MESRGHSDWNFRILLGEGVFVDIAQQVASAKLVLPFLYMALGAPVVFAGLLPPIVQISNLIAQIVAAPVIRAAPLRKWYIALAATTVAAALAVVCLAATNATVAWLTTIFLLVAMILGVGQGLSQLAFQDLLGWVLPSHRHSPLLFTQTGLAGLLAVAIAWLSQHLVDSASPLQEHIELLWAGIGAMLLAALAILFIREPARAPAPVKEGALAPGAAQARIAEMRDSFGSAFKLGWMRRFLVARALFMSIELAMPFYAIHAATMYHDNSRSLSVFVIASSAGLVLGAVIWPRIGQRALKLAMALAAVTAAAAGALALTIDLLPALQTHHLHAGVFALVALADQGISNPRKVYLVGLASHDERPFCIAVSNVVGGVVGMVIAFLFGAIAHLQGVEWPLWLIIGLNVAAALYTIRLPTLKPGRTPAGHTSGIASAGP